MMNFPWLNPYFQWLRQWVLSNPWLALNPLATLSGFTVAPPQVMAPPPPQRIAAPPTSITTASGPVAMTQPTPVATFALSPFITLYRGAPIASAPGTPGGPGTPGSVGGLGAREPGGGVGMDISPGPPDQGNIGSPPDPGRTGQVYA
jgi:hypothetical protein